MIEGILSNFKWYRNKKGGVWERWILDACGGPRSVDVWFHLDRTTKEARRRPNIICKGTPVVEDYRRGTN